MSHTAAGTVIVGAGLAAVRTTDQLRRAGYTGPITIIGDEEHLPYDRPPLSKELLRGQTEDVTLKPADFYRRHDVTLLLGSPARSVDPRAATVTLADGAGLRYDQLVIATGLRPRRMPTTEGLAGVCTLRSLDDGVALRRRAAAARRAVVVGAGFIGCEVAASLRHLGVAVTLVEPQPAPLAAALGEHVGGLIARLHRAEGVEVRTGAQVAGVGSSDDGGRVGHVLLDDGTLLAADLVVVGIGSTPATGWLAGSGILVDDEMSGTGGVVCDQVGRTSADKVWALGDVAAWRDANDGLVRVEHWSNVADQARTLVAAMLGKTIPTGSAVPYFWSDQYDLKIQAVGHPQIADAVHVADDDGRAFLAYYERSGTLVGAVGAGRAEQVRAARAKIAAGTKISQAVETPPELVAAQR